MLRWPLPVLVGDHRVRVEPVSQVAIRTLSMRRGVVGGGLQRAGAWAHPLLLIGYPLANLALLLVFRPAPLADWATTWWRLGEWAAAGELYEHTWRYSPVLLPAVLAVSAAGPFVLAMAQLAAVALLSRLDRRLLYLVAFSAFFWIDLVVGNVFTFTAVAAAFAIAGSRSGSLAYLTLCLLMPRPIQLPLAVWLLWRRPQLVMPFGAILALHTAGVVLSGHGLEWLGALGRAGGTELGAAYAVGPGQWIGFWWLLVAWPLAAVMAWRGSAAMAASAGVVATPYLLPQYLLIAVVAASRPRWLVWAVRVGVLTSWAVVRRWGPHATRGAQRV